MLYQNTGLPELGESLFVGDLACIGRLSGLSFEKAFNLETADELFHQLFGIYRSWSDVRKKVYFALKQPIMSMEKLAAQAFPDIEKEQQKKLDLMLPTAPFGIASSWRVYPNPAPVVVRPPQPKTYINGPLTVPSHYKEPEFVHPLALQPA
jgi:hypothetical protein